METISLTVDKSVLDVAQRKAEEHHTTRDAVLNDWLARLALGTERVKKFDGMMARMKHVNSGGKFTREEMNERR